MMMMMMILKVNNGVKRKLANDTPKFNGNWTVGQK